MDADGEVGGTVGEGLADPGFEAGLVVWGEAAAGEPGGVEPIQGAELKLDGAGDVDLGHFHGREAGFTDALPERDALGHFEADIVATLLEGDDLGVVPLVAQPLAAGEATFARPGHEARDGLRYALSFIWAEHAQVGDAPGGQIAQAYGEAIWIGTGR